MTMGGDVRRKVLSWKEEKRGEEVLGAGSVREIFDLGDRNRC